MDRRPHTAHSARQRSSIKRMMPLMSESELALSNCAETSSVFVPSSLPAHNRPMLLIRAW